MVGDWRFALDIGPLPRSQAIARICCWPEVARVQETPTGEVKVHVRVPVNQIYDDIVNVLRAGDPSIRGDIVRANPETEWFNGPRPPEGAM